MVQQAAPAKSVQATEVHLYVVGRICSGDDCVLTQAEMRIDRQPDGSLVIIYFDPNWPLRRFEHWETDTENIERVQYFLAELAKLSPTLS